MCLKAADLGIKDTFGVNWCLLNTHRGSDMGLICTQLLSQALSQSGHSILGGGVEMQISNR